jgi:hypothetical protein
VWTGAWVQRRVQRLLLHDPPWHQQLPTRAFRRRMVAGHRLVVLPGQRSGIIPLLRGLSPPLLVWLRQQRILQLLMLVVLVSLPIHHHL